jgi:hypothetical protein
MLIENRGHSVLLCMKMLSAVIMKQNELKKLLETLHAECVGKAREFFPVEN